MIGDNPQTARWMQGSKFKALWDFIYLSGGEMIGKIAGLLAFAYLARVLAPSDYGSLEAALALLGIFALFVEFGFGATGTREIARNPDRINEFARSIPGMKFLLALISMPAMWLLAEATGGSDQSTTLVVIMSFALLPSIWNQNWLFQGLELMGAVSVSQALKMTAFVLGVVLYVNSSADLLLVGVIEVFSTLLLALYFMAWQLKRRIPIRMDLSVSRSRKLIVDSASVGLSNLVWAMNQYMPTILVAYLMGGVATAWLGAAHRIVNAIISFSLVYHFNLYPSLTRRVQQSQRAFDEIIRPSIRVTAWFGIAIALSISLTSYHICTLVFGDAFSNASLTMSVLIWSLPLTLLNGHPRWALIAKGEQRYVLYAQMSGTVTTLILCFLLIPPLGPLGGAIAMVSCSGMVWLVAQIHAIRCVAPIPSVSLVWKPASLALAIIAAMAYLGADSFVANILALAAFVLLAPLIDTRLISDMHNLSRIKSDLST